MDSFREALDFTLFWEYRSLLLGGLAFNAYVWVLAALLAVFVGLGGCLLRISRNRAARALGTAYAELLRNTPEYILLTWIHFVLPLLLTYAFNTRLNFPPMLSAVLALGLAYSAYMTETFRAGVQSIPRGHTEAGRALGMSNALIMRRLILPQALRRVLPELLNQLVSLFKATTLVSLIAVPDLLYNVVIVTQEEMRPLPLYSYAALVYCAIITTASTLVRRATDGWRKRGWA